MYPGYYGANRRRPPYGYENANAYGYNYTPLYQGYGHRCHKARNRPNDIEEATRAHVKANEEYEEAKEIYKEAKEKCEETKRKLDEALKKLNEAKGRESAW
jgi:hypothetical protein